MATTVNGKPVLVARIDLPARGAWIADVEVDTDELLPTEARAVSIVVDGGTLVGTVRRQGIESSKLSARIIGGGNGFGTTLAAAGYRQVPASIVLGDVLSAVGETLSATSASLTTKLAYWSRIAGAASEARDQLLAALGYTWRTLPDGSIWVGTDTWQESVAEGEVLKELEGSDVRVISPADGSALLLPGTTFEGIRVASSVYTIGSKATRVEAWAP